MLCSCTEELVHLCYEVPNGAELRVPDTFLLPKKDCETDQ